MHKTILILILLISGTLFAQVRKEFITLEDNYHSGKLNEARQQLKNLKPNKDEERALLLYYDAMLKKDRSDALALLISCTQMYPKTHHGQLAMLEAAKLHILEHDMTQAQTLLRGISSADIVERFHWLAVTFYWLDDYSAAIANAENYSRLNPNGKEIENTLHLIADSYIGQKKYQSAVSTLNKVSRLKDYDRQYYFYKLGLAHELNNNSKDALNSFREGYELDRYSQIAFQIEERLFALRTRVPSLDLSFLYPYKPLEIVADTTLVVSGTEPEEQVETQLLPQTSASLPQLPPIDNSKPIKISAKPNTGFYLQAGRFSVEPNAERLSRSIRGMNIPAQYYEDRSTGQATWVVLAGPFDNREETDRARNLLMGGEINSFIVQY